MIRSSKLFALVGALAVTAAALGVAQPVAEGQVSGNPAYDLDQCANGTATSPARCDVVGDWINGNLNESKARYAEGDSVPYRARFSNLTPGSWTVTIAHDSIDSNKHALDYLTTHNRTVATANACAGAGVAGCGLPATTTTLAIPKDAQAPPGQIPGVFTMYGAVLNSVSSYSYSSKSGATETSVKVTFTVAAVSNPVLAWGGHIATRLDWGAGNSAAAISGSPFHMRIIDLNGSGGNQDRSLSSSAVIFPGSLTVVKVAAPKGAQAFNFSSPGLTPSSFTLVDDGDEGAPVARQTFQIFDFDATWTISEATPAGWAVTAVSCVDPSNNTTTSPTSAAFKVAEAEDVTCTFTNVRNPSITALKTADPTSIDEPGGPVRFSVVVRNDSAVENVKLVSLVDSPYGNVTAVGGSIVSTTCQVPQTIAPNGTYQCAFQARVNGDAGTVATDVLTANAVDLRDKPLSDTDDASVTVLDVKPLLQVDKSVSPSELLEPGGTVEFKVDVNNPSKEELTLNTLTDDKFGPLTGKGTCSVPQKIAPGATYTCRFSAPVAGDPRTPHVNTITGTATDNENNPVTDTGMATVRFTDVLPALVVDKSASPSQLPEPGGKVTFTVVVTNPQGAVESIDLTALQDDRFGNLDGKGTCDVSPAVVLAPAARYTCAFDAQIPGNAKATHVNVLTATVRDDDGNIKTDKDDATVTITDALPSIEVEKTALPVSVAEPGGTVTFGVRITNPAGAAEPVTIVSLVDDIYGDLAKKGSCLLTAALILAPGGSYSCSFTGGVTGKPGDSKTDTIVGKVTDDEGNIAEDIATATVTITDVLPSVIVDKTADPVSIPEPGGPVTFTVRVTNPGGAVEGIFLAELTDSLYGNLDGEGTCDVTPPVALAAGAEYVCTFTKTVSGDFPDVHRNRVTAAVTDDEKNRVTGSDEATVPITDVLPTILVDKSAAPELLPEPGGNVTYSVTVTNTSVEVVTLNSLVDEPGGNLAGQGTCLKDGPAVLEPTKTYTCTFPGTVNGDARSVHSDTVTATAADDEGNQATNRDTATVTLTDVTPTILVAKGAAPSQIAEPGDEVTFNVVVTNPATAVEPVRLTSLVDSDFGPLDGKGTCKLAEATAIARGGQYSCSFSETISGNAGFRHDNTVTAVAQDNEGNSTPPAADDATVTVLNVAPAIVVDKLPSTNQLPEPGGTVQFTVTVSNPGTAEDLTLASLNDNIYGDLNGKGNCAVPQTIAKGGGQYQCTFPGLIENANAGSTHTNTVTAVARDDDDDQVTDTADATVNVTDVKPTVLVTKSAQPPTLPEPGGTATFTVTVTNPAGAVEPIRLNGLVDDVYGGLNGEGTCDVTPPVELAPNAQYTCTFTGPVTGNADFVHTDEVTAMASDDEGNDVTAKDKADVTLSDVLPALKLDKTAGASAVHAGDDVTYTYAIRNLGIEALRDVAVTDDRCSPVTRSGGDTNSNSLLDLTEVWTYTCTAKLTGTTTNTATGTGNDDDGNTATDFDTATVTVVNPQIVIDKVADLTSVAAGSSVTYTYTVTNPGNAPLADVTVTDDKCGPVTLTGGDADSDSLLDPGETWRFTCRAALFGSGPVTNTGTVRGKDPIGQEVTATDTAVVSVLETVVLPGTETRPDVLTPAAVSPPTATLPITGAELARLVGSGLAMLAGGLVLRPLRRPRRRSRRRES